MALSEEDEIELIRRKRMEQMQQQAIQQKLAQQQQQQEYETKKYTIMRAILSQEARQRLENIRMVRAQYAEQIELQLIQLYQSGRLKGATPLPDNTFKKLLEQLSDSKKKPDFKIKNI